MATATIEVLSTGDAARLLGVSAEMVRYWHRTGRLPARRTPSGRRVFDREDVERLAAERAQGAAREAPDG